jgi:integrase
MARPVTKKEALFGPYLERGGYRVIYRSPEGKTSSKFYETEQQAKRAAEKLKRSIGKAPAVSVDKALEQYEIYQRHEKGNKMHSVVQTAIRLRRFFVEPEVLLRDLDEARVTSYYERFRNAPGKHGKPLSVDYHRNTLVEARSFLKWCVVKKKWIAENPLDGVEGVGKRRHGKEQLRVDEARRWLATAMRYADEGEAGAVAAMMTLLMGLRCCEVVPRVARDVDDGGALLWIPSSKTAAGKRNLQVPEMLRPYLVELAKHKKPEQLLFGKHDRAWPRLWVQKICREADVPVVTAHGQRGLHATLAVSSGITAHAVAAALGHESFRITAQSYARSEAIDSAKQERVMSALGPQPKPRRFVVLQGGRDR